MISDTNTARHVFQLILEANGKLDESIAVVLENCDEQTVQNYKRAVGAVMWEVWTQLVAPLASQHPELIPEEHADLRQFAQRMPENGSDLSD